MVAELLLLLLLQCLLACLLTPLGGTSSPTNQADDHRAPSVTDDGLKRRRKRSPRGGINGAGGSSGVWSASQSVGLSLFLSLRLATTTTITLGIEDTQSLTCRHACICPMATLSTAMDLFRSFFFSVLLSFSPMSVALPG